MILSKLLSNSWWLGTSLKHTEFLRLRRSFDVFNLALYISVILLLKLPQTTESGHGMSWLFFLIVFGAGNFLPPFRFGELRVKVCLVGEAFTGKLF